MRNNTPFACRHLHLFLCLILLQFSSIKAHAIAYCAIREPVSTIQEFFPAYSSYQTQQIHVEDSAREDVLKALPNSNFQETGTHSLYRVYESEALIGFVHARTEKGVFGLDEIIWIINPDMTIETFKYQKNRSGSITPSDMATLTTILKNSNLAELIDAEKKSDLDSQFHRIIRSAIKALVITKTFIIDPRNI